MSVYARIWISKIDVARAELVWAINATLISLVVDSNSGAIHLTHDVNERHVLDVVCAGLLT